MNFKKFLKNINLILSIILILSLSSKSILVEGDNIVRDYWPTNGWQTKTFEEADMNETKIDEMMEYATYHNYDLESVLIVKNGYLVFEQYPRAYENTSVHNIYSITKSTIATLIGIAIDKGYIENVNNNILDYFVNVTVLNKNTHENVTIYHLLTMTSGIQWIENDVSWGDPTNSHSNMYASLNWVEFVLNQTQQYEPGTTFYYNSGGVHLLSAIIEKATGNTTLEFAQEHLFGPLGFSSTVWDQDPQGIYIGGSDLSILPVDLTKLGYLYLNNGTWGSKQIISQEWVKNASEAITVTPWGSYGYLWWVRPEINSYFGMGNFGQLLSIIPDYDMVVTFTSFFRTGFHFPFYIDDLIKEYVIKAVQEGYWEPIPTTPATETSVSLIITINSCLLYAYLQKRRNKK